MDVPIVGGGEADHALLGTLADTENWSGDNSLLVVALYVAGALAAFNWWELWSTRNRR